jgi:hypothetical protein
MDRLFRTRLKAEAAAPQLDAFRQRESLGGRA